MAGIIGKWELVSSERFEDYMAATGVSAEMIATAAKALTPDAKLSHEISRDGETWILATTTPLGSKEIRFKLGQEFETKTLDGRTVKCVTSLDGDTLVEIQTGDGFVSKNVRTPKGDQMTTTLSGNGVTCTRVYKRLN